MEAWWVALLRQQRSDGFPDLSGAHASFTVPISDRLVTRLIAERIPRSIPIREFELVAYPDDVVSIRVRLTKPAILPPIRMRLVIERQPDLPSSPILVLAVTPPGVASLAVTGLDRAGLLPEGMRFDRGRFLVDVAAIFRRVNAADALDFLTDLRITTIAHRVIVQARLAVTPQRESAMRVEKNDEK